MTENQFDDIFKKRLEHFDSSVPDDMWQRINKKDKDRKFFFIPRWYMIASMLLLIGFGSYFVFVNNKDSVKENREKSVNEIAKNDNDPIKNKIDTATNFNDLSRLNNNVSSNTNKVNKQIFASQKKPVKTSNKRNYTNKTSLTANKNLQISNGIIDAKNLLSNDIISDDVIQSKNIDKNNLKKTSSLKDSITQITQDTTEANKKNDDESFLDKFSLELYASPDLPLNNISSDNSSYEQYLKDASKMQLSYSFGVRLGVKINKNLSAKIGVHYSRINERVSDSILSGNDFKPVSFSSIDVPLMLSYTKQWPNKLSGAVSSGIFLNLSSKYKGVYTSDTYKNTTGVSIFLGFDISKQLNNKMDVFAEPYFRYHIKSITTNLQSFDQKIHTTGVSLGLRYRLFKK